ncbi:precorrin-8X methylmutase [Entomobacter blattae]|uniref:Precorrin-8X methylmutase n=1 Tax=Entomobacter blattae TaxID=2762277 RepID=A0A7H1NQ26_9PROT|nr:precorrin-8X methylmutase [Entomobacter blattae]QNT77886.1 Precorrin-8X methylmutase [Entomobacter blattae]
MTNFDYLRNGEDIYRLSFETIQKEANLSGFSPAEAWVATRMIHACGRVDIAPLIQFSPDLVATAQRALSLGQPILCDSEMLAHGLTKNRFSHNNPVICTLHDPQTPLLAQQLGTTRSAAALELWKPHMAGSLIAIGNAPTALFHLLEMLDNIPDKPAAIIGIPVGFVGAEDSKTALAQQAPVPFLTLHGRQGGSAITAAALNALASSHL